MDPEIEAMNVLVERLTPLDDRARARVLAWLVDWSGSRDEGDVFISRERVCGLLDVRAVSLNGLIAKGEFPEPARKIGDTVLFWRSEVQAWLSKERKGE